ncbi:MAG: substrate-binding domain-containing protein [Defluviitaleaceae bacterium]|nr:substrate-binding domain-containing protein [Defluviitaleaceae bacterium]
MMKKGFIRVIATTALAVMVFSLAGCGGNGGNANTQANTPSPAPTVAPTPTPASTVDEPAMSGQITLVTREDGSGTRGAFVEIVDITIDGNDNISLEAVVAPGTSVMMTSVAENPLAIGYASTGVALTDDRVKVLSIDGIAPTVENMLNGTYAIQRPFLIGYNTEAGLNELAQDFVDFIFSAQGQDVVAGRGYVPFVANAPDYTASGLTGTIVVNGSSSVYSLMGHLSAAYRDINPGVTIDVHGAGTGHGISAARDGLADIAMSSRDLRESELEFMTPLTIAIDGIAVIVHPDNEIEGLTLNQVREIFLGGVERWENIR